MAAEKDTHRVTATIKQETYERLCYWAQKKGVTINTYLSDAIDFMIAFENRDYPLPTLEQARLNQLIDVITILSANVKSLETSTLSSLESLTGLVRGDNYLMEHEDGDI
jgi:predicted DNA-binding protein